MPKKKAPPQLTSYDDIFQTDDIKADTAGQKVADLPLADLHPFEGYPFKVREDAAMLENAENIREGNPVRPCMVRPRNLGGYEVIAGQRDVRACELAEKTTMPAFVCELDDDSATIAMVNANLPQEQPLDSEMAWALRMKLEALCHRGRKLEGVDPGTLSVDILVEQTGKTKTQIYRYVHLTELVPELSDMVDDKRIAFSVAADYLYKLSRQEQAWLLDSMARYEATPSASQALRLRQYHHTGALTPELVDEVMAEQKKEPVKVTLTANRLKQYFPVEYTPRQMEDVILRLLDNWQRTQGLSA